MAHSTANDKCHVLCPASIELIGKVATVFADICDKGSAPAEVRPRHVINGCWNSNKGPLPAFRAGVIQRHAKHLTDPSKQSERYWRVFFGIEGLR